uniref:Coiled-coil domain-containing protein n=1 Tax=Strigamia maritima TaxID=126957 RepID=T1IPE4_STRMM
MPKKFQGENSKANAARARKEATKQAEVAKKEKEEADAFWKDDDRNVQRKQQRKDEREKKKQESADRKAASKQMLEEEMSELKATATKPIPNKVTRAQIVTTVTEKQNKNKTPDKVVYENEKPIEENVNRLTVDGEEARTIEAAISVLSSKDEEVDRHPERRVKAAYAAFEAENLPRVKAENPHLRLSQWKEIVKKDWMKSPKNPLIQMKNS